MRVTLHMDFPREVKLIKQIFSENNLELYLVGGCVRDALLRIEPKDFDLVTNAIPDRVIELLAGQSFVKHILETGKAFGVINVVTDGGEFEIATMRSDGEYSNSRRPDSVTFGDMKNDIMRRDLTINALYYDIDTREVIDLVGGVDDIINSIIRTVGKPEDRFKEDKLRILRCIRFAARLNAKLSGDVGSALLSDCSLENISGERIRDEFMKGLKSAKSNSYFLSIIQKYKLFDWIFPNLDITNIFIDEKAPLVQIAILLHTNPVGLIKKKLNELKYSVDEVKYIAFLVSLQSLSIETAVALKKQHKLVDIDFFDVILFGFYMGINKDLLVKFLNFELTISGEDVMKEFNLKPSKELGDKINELEEDNFLKLLKD